MGQPLWKTAWPFLKRLNIESPCDLGVIPLLDVYSRELKMSTQKLVHECSQKVETPQMSINR